MPYMEFWNNHYRPTAWAIGPLCLSQPPSSSSGDAGRPSWMEWLDEKAAAGRAVLYVALGTSGGSGIELTRETTKV